MKYNVIYADPPWSYTDKATAWKRGAEFKYPCMKIEDIRNLPIADLADENCILFIWVTFPFLREWLDVIDSWWFKYKTVWFNWVKKNKKAESWFWWMWNWTRSNSEVCLIATKWKPKRFSAKVHSVIDTPIERHSKKPDIVRDKIEELTGGGNMIELFARQKAEGWDSWGNEVESDINLN